MGDSTGYVQLSSGTSSASTLSWTTTTLNPGDWQQVPYKVTPSFGSQTPYVVYSPPPGLTIEEVAFLKALIGKLNGIPNPYSLSQSDDLRRAIDKVVSELKEA